MASLPSRPTGAPLPSSSSAGSRPPATAALSRTSNDGVQSTISAHMGSAKRSSYSAGGKLGKKRSQPEESLTRPSSVAPQQAAVDPTVRTSSHSPTKRRPSPPSLAHRGPPPPTIQYFPPGASYDPSLYYAVVPTTSAGQAQGAYPPSPAPPPHLIQPASAAYQQPFLSSQPLPPPHMLHHAPLARRQSHPHAPSPPPHARPPSRPAGPCSAAEPPASPQHAEPSAEASSSRSPSKPALAPLPDAASGPPPAPKPKRKYTKRADFWIENGGPGRRGLLAASKNDAAVAKVGESSAAGSESGKSTPQTGIAPPKLRRKSTASSSKNAPPPAPSTSKSPPHRPATPAKPAVTLRAPPTLPRTISAPALLTGEDGKVTLSSTRVLASELALLQSSCERSPDTRPSRRLINDAAAKERTRKRLAAFADGVEFFASPTKETASGPVRRPRAASVNTRASALVPARVAGMGRVAIAQGSLERMVEAGVQPCFELPSSDQASSAGVSSSSSASSGLVAPDWPDACHPWSQAEADRRRLQTAARREVLRSVEQYLESCSSDDDDDPSGTDEHLSRRRLSRGSSSSIEDHLLWSQRGGKISSSLLERSRLKASQSVPSLSSAFDPSDARQALIYRTQASLPPPLDMADDDDSASATAYDGQARSAEARVGPSAIACICRDHVAEGAMVECNGCTYWFHLSCLGIQESELGEDEWFCWRCAPAGDQLPAQFSDPIAIPHTPKTASPELEDGSDAEGEPSTPATVALEPSLSVNAHHHRTAPLGTPVQRFATPLLPSATGFSSSGGPASFQHSPSYSRMAGGGAPRLPPLPLVLQGTPGPSRAWDHRHVITPRVPTHTRDHEEVLFDLSSTPSRHLSRELPFGGTPISRVGAGGAGRGGVRTGGPRLPSFGSFATPSQEFFHGLHASPHPSSSSSGSGQLPGLDHYLSSVDSSGPLSPYQPLSKWHHSPSIHNAAGGRGAQAEAGRTHFRAPGDHGGEQRQAKEQVRFGEPLEGLRGGIQSGK